jgi:hypothetical protein
VRVHLQPGATPRCQRQPRGEPCRTTSRTAAITAARQRSLGTGNSSAPAHAASMALELAVCLFGLPPHIVICVGACSADRGRLTEDHLCRLQDPLPSPWHPLSAAGQWQGTSLKRHQVLARCSARSMSFHLFLNVEVAEKSSSDVQVNRNTELWYSIEFAGALKPTLTWCSCCSCLWLCHFWHAPY